VRERVLLGFDGGGDGDGEGGLLWEVCDGGL
jgi:hypothetical protein